MDATLHIVTLDQKPCVVHYLEHYNRFIVGTYELFPSIEDARLKLNSHLDDSQLKKVLEKINYRAGKLILLRGNDVSVPSIEYEFDCEVGGGVFDAKIRYNKMDSSYNIFVAHSNGTIGIYKLSLHCGTKISLREHINNLDSKMLTSIDIYPESPGCGSRAAIDDNQTRQNSSSSSSNSVHSSQSSINSSSVNNNSITLNRLVVGDSEGYITVINQGEHQIRLQTNQDNSIWQVKSLRLSSGRDVIFVGSENCSWYIYGFDELAERLVLLYKNVYKDFSAGVTSISILEKIRSVDYDLVEILLGSYDETLQTYHVKLNHDGISKPHVCHKNTMSIENGGIWRVKPYRGNNRKQFCIAAMYAGSYVLTFSGFDEKQPQIEAEQLTRLIDTDSLKLAHKPLHYDIDVSKCNTTYCIADFNNSLCLFKTIDQ